MPRNVQHPQPAPATMTPLSHIRNFSLIPPINPLLTNRTARCVNPAKPAQGVHGGCTGGARPVPPGFAMKHRR